MSKYSEQHIVILRRNSELIMIIDEKIFQLNYVRKASKLNKFWFSLHKNKLDKLILNCGDNFNIIIYDGKEANQFYILPYFLIKNFLIEEYLSKDKRSDKRWVGSISNHILRIRNCPFDFDIGLYFGNNNLIDNNGNFQKVSEDEENDYAIQNRTIEIQARVKQSVFRKKVLSNFRESCCLTGINETPLIVASHIVPWANKVEYRLDPANGLALFVTYDKLFDLGYFSLDNNLKVILTSKIKNFSPELQSVLNNIDNKKVTEPLNYIIKKEYLEYHRDMIFIT